MGPTRPTRVGQPRPGAVATFQSDKVIADMWGCAIGEDIHCASDLQNLVQPT